ncbi:helix-turn-helix domain-containing protein [Levilactobacillus mulengensis]|uniref:helix-turn-helix domain-containing protein n=1 Tax=Levilactobacillus mulengensis TaxID=2486025 RepID=UPI000F787812|nr:helix-turn-helix domain-containing protein [Levilactobacillus mulengensis]
MSNSLPKQKNYSNLAHALAKFTSLTQINALCYDFNGILLKDDAVFLNDSAIKQNLADEDLKHFAIFPVTLGTQLWGSIMCDAKNVSKKRLILAQSYLTDMLRESFIGTTGSLTIWDALTTNQIKKINYFHNFFPLSDQSDSLSATSPTSGLAPINGHTIGNYDAYHSIRLAMAYIHKNIQQSFSLNDVAEASYLSPSYLSRLFKKYLHVNFVEYVNNQKIALAQEKLALTLIPINQISAQLGFSQTSYFTKIFKRKTHTTPSEFRQHNHAIQKVYTIPRDLDWDDSSSIYDVTKNYFERHDINYQTDSDDDGAAYLTRIGNLTDKEDSQGWVYTVDGQQPSESANEVDAKNKSVIQWVYMNYAT